MIAGERHSLGGILVAMLMATQTVMAEVRDAFSGILPPTDRSEEVSLNGTWKLKVEKGIREGGVPTEGSGWSEVAVPACWEVLGLCKATYDKADSLTGYYRREFEVPEEWKGRRVCLRTDGVLYGYDVWVNEKKVGEWRSAYNTAVFDITPYLTKKGRQKIALKVLTRYRGSDFDYNDDWAPSGIFRDVSLFAVPETHVSDITIVPEIDGNVRVDVRVANRDKQTTVQHKIYDVQGREVGETRVESPRLWTAETPYLYTMVTTLKRKGQTLQTFTHKIGFRKLEIEGNILKLNGRPIKLRGVTCHSTDPKTGKVVSEELTKRDMELMKKASVNYIRTSHYPREPRFYELADSMGFYVIDEVPFGYGDKNLGDSTYYEILQQRAQATIRRDKNHACVLIWSLGNENPLTTICQRLGDYVKSELDGTRPICYPQVGSYFRKFDYKFPKVADIYAPHYPTTGQVGGFYQRADRPVIFTEYCHTLGVSFEDHDRQWETIERTPCIAGGSVWEWVDQGMPFREKMTSRYGYEERVFTSEDGGFEMYGNKGTDGLLYADRTPLPNYYELQRNYARAFVGDSIADGKIKIVNRYDFIDLKDNVTFRWELTEDRRAVASGAFSPSCPARTETEYQIGLPETLDTRKLCLLHFTICDRDGRVFLRQTVRVNSHDVAGRLIEGLDRKSGDPEEMIADEMRIRMGRKATMAEKIKVGKDRYEKYLRKKSSVDAKVEREKVGEAYRYTYSITPDTAGNKFLSEVGIAMLLDKKIDRVRWIGEGRMATYPGRRRANRYGMWGMRAGDLYFEGNRMGVDAALLTDEKGDGVMIVCRGGNVSLEQTDRGIVVSVNGAVAGQGPKFARTAFPVMAKKVGTVSGEFYMYRVEKGNIPEVVRTLFGEAKDVEESWNPYLTQYDTYLMRYEDVAEGVNED
ncbi:MAG: hypothetical protein II951_12955 [Bacteroidales bacterium]|nr:hypothetical protein [Bacteroidales bacterium]